MTENDRQSVYLIEAENGLIKIGISKNVQTRFESLLSSSPIPLKLIGQTEPTETTHDIEKRIHRLYLKKNSHGEWFKLTKSDTNDICKNFSFTKTNNKFKLSKPLRRNVPSTAKRKVKKRPKFSLKYRMQSCYLHLSHGPEYLNSIEIINSLNELKSLQNKWLELCKEHNKDFLSPKEINSLIRKIKQRKLNEFPTFDIP